MHKRIVSVAPAYARPALPVLPRRSRCLVHPNCGASRRHGTSLASRITWYIPPTRRLG
jgi:hypothetical protein